MLNEKVIEKYYCNKNIHKVPIEFACECLKAMENVLEEIRKENPYAALAELFDE